MGQATEPGTPACPFPPLESTPVTQPSYEIDAHILIEPNPRLGSAQQSVIAEDFGMNDGEAVLPVRQAPLYYSNKRLRLDVAKQIEYPREIPVVAKNRVDLEVVLAEAMR